ncbi:hypothetical protein [Deinococcus hohokamensis]|uniref:Uncharacterized protein n=1 Tax=Deinococcus hohokamensis TaxID=309883 RepID=A0ABV9I9K1_9DEIO
MPGGALTELLTFFTPLSALQRQEGGAVTLLTPGTNVLGLNATYLPPGDVAPALSPAIQAWHTGHDLPLVAASLVPLPGAHEVVTLQVGVLAPGGPPDPTGQLRSGAAVVVEQISRLHLEGWAASLAQSRGTPAWAPALARHLAGVLEGQREYVLLQAYGRGETVGGLLWQARPEGGAAHLWGARTPEAARALLRAAASLASGPLWVSALPDDEVPLRAANHVFFSRLNEDTPYFSNAPDM